MITEALDLSSLRQRLMAFQEPALLRSLSELLLSALPLALIWAGAWVAVSFGLWPVALLLSIPAAGFVVRLFMIQHDCGHRSFFKSPAANDWVGRMIGAITATPYDCWRRTHAIHHATSGDLDRRGLGALAILTVEESRPESVGPISLPVLSQPFDPVRLGTILRLLPAAAPACRIDAGGGPPVAQRHGN